LRLAVLAYLQTRHFIVNTGNATAADIEDLIHYVQNKVQEHQGVELQTEVCMVGEVDKTRFDMSNPEKLAVLLY